MDNIIFDCGTKDFERVGFRQWYGAGRTDGSRAFLFGSIGGYDKYGTLYLCYKKAHRCITLGLGLSSSERTRYDQAEVKKVLEAIPEYTELASYCKERAANTFTREELDTLYIECQALALKAREALVNYFSNHANDDAKEAAEFLRTLRAEYLNQLSTLDVRVHKIGWANIIALTDETALSKLEDYIRDIGKNYKYYSEEQIKNLVNRYSAHYLKQDRSVATHSFDMANKILDQVEKDLKG